MSASMEAIQRLVTANLERVSNGREALPHTAVGQFKAKTLIPKKYTPKSPIFGLKPRFFGLKALDLYPKIWLVLAVFLNGPD